MDKENKQEKYQDEDRRKQKDRDADRDFGVSQLQLSQHILKVLDATDLEIVDKVALAGTLQGINGQLDNVRGSLT